MRSRLLLAVVVSALAISGCGGTDDPNQTADVATADDGASAIGAAEICERLSAAAVAADTGLDIVSADAADATTPQCAYEYTNDTGGLSNLTVAAMRSGDMGGLVGSEAFDFVVGINEAVAGEGFERETVAAGDAAVRISGRVLHLGVVQLGDRIFTVVVPADDADADTVRQLITTMATTLA